MAFNKAARRQRIKKKIRRSIRGNISRPRLSVFRSNKEIYAQIVDDQVGHTICSASSKGIEGDRITQAKQVGKTIAEKALSLGFDKIVFDRSGYLYHGRVKALADGARETGIIF